MKNILVPCDFSIPALEAYQFAEDIAARSAAEVHLLKVIDLPFTYEPSIGMPPYYLNTQVLKEIEEDTTRELEKVKISYPGQGNVHVAAQSGPVTHTILQFIRDHAIDLVVMGTRGSGGLKEYLIGSNTEKIVRFSTVPVFAIRQKVPLSDIRNIVLPVTLTPGQDAFIARVKSLQSFFQATLHLLLINTPHNFNRTQDEVERLEAYARQYGLSDFTVNTRSDFNEEDAVIHFVKEIKADMVAMRTHGRKGLAHLFLGSVTEDVVNHIECPIWTSSVK